MLCVNEWCWICEWIVSHMEIVYATYINESYHIHMRHVTYVIESCHTYGWSMARVCMSHVTHKNELCHTYTWVMSHIQMRLYTRILSHAGDPVQKCWRCALPPTGAAQRRHRSKLHLYVYVYGIYIYIYLCIYIYIYIYVCIYIYICIKEDNSKVIDLLSGARVPNHKNKRWCPRVVGG